MDSIKCYVCMTEENCNCDEDQMLIAENEHLHETLDKSRKANIAAIERAIKAEQKVEELENRIFDLLDEVRTLGGG